MEKIKIFGLEFISSNYETIIDDILINDSFTSDSYLPLFITPNSDQVVNLERRRYMKLKYYLQQAKYILPDGQPIVWVSFFKGLPLKMRLTGSDFFPRFWEKVKFYNKKTFFILPNEGVLGKLNEEYQNIDFYVPPIIKLSSDNLISKEIVLKITKQIIEFDPEYIFLGIGFPKQELLSLQLIKELRKKKVDKFPLFFLLGASFEFYVGQKSRAPKIFHQMGLEWFYRLYKEPKRLFLRYLRSNTVFIFIAIRELIKK